MSYVLFSNISLAHVFIEMTHLHFIRTVLALALWQGLTGRPGDAGPQGKVGPSVSSPSAAATAIKRYQETLYCIFLITCEWDRLDPTCVLIMTLI